MRAGGHQMKFARVRLKKNKRNKCCVCYRALEKGYCEWQKFTWADKEPVQDLGERGI